MKKSAASKVTTWMIRILCTVIVIIGVCLLVLSALGGTSEYHRQGLEQAFSDSLKSNVTIGALDEFNIFPQLALKAKDVHGVSKTGGDEFMAGDIRIAFGFSDLLMGRQRIEDFQLDNLRFASASKNNLRLEHAGIDARAQFSGHGQYAGRSFDFALPLAKVETGRSSYYFGEKNPFSGHYGSLSFQGDIKPSGANNVAIVQNLVVTAEGKMIATGQGLRRNGTIIVEINCVAPPEKTASGDLQSLRQLSFVDVKSGCGK